MPVYLIQAGDERGPVKIGFSRFDLGVKGRLATLQSMTYLPLTIARTLADGCLIVEGWMHWRFASARLRGEWFTFSPEMLSEEPPARADAVRRLRPLIRHLGVLRIAEGTGRSVTALHRWSRSETAPRDAATAIAGLANNHGLRVNPEFLMRPVAWGAA